MGLKKKKDSILKMDKKIKNGKQEPELSKLRDSMVKDLQTRSEIFAEQERMAVREISCQERTHFTTFAACLKPVMAEECAMLSQAKMLREVTEKLNDIISDPFKNLHHSENNLEPLNTSETKPTKSKHISRKCFKSEKQSQRFSTTHRERETKQKQSGTNQPALRSLSPYSVPITTPIEDTKVTARPPLPQKAYNITKAAKIHGNVDTAEAVVEKRPAALPQQGHAQKIGPPSPAKQGSLISDMREQETKNKGTGNKKMMEESVKRQGVSNSSSSGSEDFNLHFTPGPVLTGKGKPQQTEVQPPPTVVTTTNAQQYPSLPHPPVTTLSNKPTSISASTHDKSRAVPNPCYPCPYISKPITPYTSVPPCSTPIHILKPALPNVGMPNSVKVSPFTPTPSIASPPVPSPPIKTIGDQTAKAALIRTLITQRLNSCSPVPSQQNQQ